MSKFFGNRPVILHRPASTPARFMLRCAAGISLVFLAAHLAGLREFTCVLNGTVGSVALGWELSQLLALMYIFFFLGFVILVPALVLAAMILTLWHKCCKNGRHDPNKQPAHIS